MVEFTIRKTVFREFSSRDTASIALARDIAETLQRALSRRTKAHLVVSGGTSPVQFFHYLRETQLDWENVIVSPSDERDVPAGHADRNDAMIERELLRSAAAAAKLAGLLPRDSGVSDELLDSPAPEFDAVVLGMGEDGHTASLFPDSPTIKADLLSKESTVRVAVPRLDATRVSLTPSALLNTARIDLLFFGAEKRSVFEQASQSGPISTLPVRAVLNQDQVPVRVWWAP